MRRAAPTWPIWEEMCTIVPRMSPSIIPRATAWAMKKAARTFNAITRSKSATVTSGKGAGRLVPALFTRMWNGPAAAILARAPSSSATSIGSASADPPSARIATAAASTSSRVRAAITTCAPAAASATAAPRPMPRPAPVTNARRPSSRMVEGVLGNSIALTPQSGRRAGRARRCGAGESRVGHASCSPLLPARRRRRA